MSERAKIDFKHITNIQYSVRMMRFQLPRFANGVYGMGEGGLVVDKMKELDLRLAKAKSLLDGPAKEKNYSKVTYLLEPFNCEKMRMVQLSQNYNITNAWIKAYEIVDSFDLISYFRDSEVFHFDNAAFPGSFILAIHHYFNTKSCNKKAGVYEWFASSLVTDTECVRDHLEDMYDLHKNYPERWVMSAGVNNGDLTDVNNLRGFKQKLPAVNLYTGDLGFDVSDDYNAQERSHVEAHFGQLLSGLLVLKQGGFLIVKQYTFFEKASISSLAVMAQFFENVYICKPASSKMDNSEVYFVGENFQKFDGGEELIELMLGRLEGKMTHVPIYEPDLIDPVFTSSVYNAACQLTAVQIEKIEFNLAVYNEVVAVCGMRGVLEMYKMAREKSEELRKSVLKKWYAMHRINKIRKRCLLNMKDAYGQKRFIR